ncbi:NADH-cytochrome b5 reductase [Ascosphaera atra]|nr:NADH-cytochrome b5 reductase [Ascosphaera atra]
MKPHEPPEGWTGGVGFVTPEMLKEKMPAAADDVKILICGPPPMVSAMRKATATLGYKKAGLVSKLHDQVFCF